jgi:SsrA-binding protein
MELLSENKRVYFDYEILETFEGGIMLTGHEVRSIKLGHANISGTHAIIRNNRVELVGMSISSFQPNNTPEYYDSDRTRIILLGKKEIHALSGKLKNGLTLIPIKLYNKGGLIKVLIGLGRGKKKQDKRDVIKKRETEREIRRFFKNNTYTRKKPRG